MTVKKFFKKFGLPENWVASDSPDWDEGDIVINEADSNEFPAINDGDEVSIDGDNSIFGPEVHIEGSKIAVKGTDNAKNREWFSTEMIEGEDAANLAKFVEIVNEMKDHEGGPTW